ncbi:hypothetical protein JOM56_004487 [Amanita muscaria]
MTRSTRSVQSHKQAKKAFKQEASDAGYCSKPEVYCMWNAKVAEGVRDKARRPPLHSTRNPRRMDGMKWNGSTFVCPENVEDNDFSPVLPREEYWCDGDSEEVNHTNHGMEVCLMDFARPAKPRGVKKEFEVVDKLPSVIALDEESWESYNSDDWYLPEDMWEEVFMEGTAGVASRKTFADVLRGG